MAFGNSIFVAVGLSAEIQTSTWETVLSGFNPSDDLTIYKEFTSTTARFWRLKLTGMSAPPEMAICVWGEATELKYAKSFDPNAREDHANINVSSTGHLLGIHNNYVERSMNLSFQNITSTIYSRLNDWWEGSGLDNFFVILGQRKPPHRGISHEAGYKIHLPVHGLTA